MNKRGISAIVATVLIILIVVAGVGIIWVAILPMIQEDIGGGLIEIETEVSILIFTGYTVYDPEKHFAFVQVERGTDDKVVEKLNFIFTIDGESVTYETLDAPSVNQRKTYTFNFSRDGIFGTPTHVAVAPVFAVDDVGEITSRVEMPIKLASVSSSDDDRSSGNRLKDGGVVIGGCESDDECGMGNICDVNEVCVKRTMFVLYLDGDNNDYGRSVIETSDGDFIVTGWTRSYGGFDYDVLLAKFDSTGNEQWTKTLGGDGDDYGRSVIETSDGGFIVTGDTFSYGSPGFSDVLLAKFDSTGNEQWTKTLGEDKNDYGRSVIETSDGDFVVTGDTQSYGSGLSDVLLAKFDSTGNEQWTKTLGGDENDHGYSVIETSDGGFVVTGWTRSYGGLDFDVLLAKFNSTGAEQWTKTLGGSDSDYGRSVIETSDGGFVVTGDTSYGSGALDVLLAKFDSTGNEQWTKTLGGSNMDYGRSVIETSDGGFVVAGYTFSYGSPGFSDVLLAKFNSTGAEQWTKTLGGDGDDHGRSVVETSDGGFIVTGDTSYGGLDYHVLLAKFNSTGNIGVFGGLESYDVIEGDVPTPVWTSESISEGDVPTPVWTSESVSQGDESAVWYFEAEF